MRTFGLEDMPEGLVFTDRSAIRAAVRIMIGTAKDFETLTYEEFKIFADEWNKPSQCPRMLQRGCYVDGAGRSFGDFRMHTFDRGQEFETTTLPDRVRQAIQGAWSFIEEQLRIQCSSSGLGGCCGRRVWDVKKPVTIGMLYRCECCSRVLGRAIFEQQFN